MQRLGLLIGMFLVCGGIIMGTSDAQSRRVSDERFAKLAKGVNFSLWFWYPYDQPYTRMYISDDELAMLKEAGLTHVRLPFDPDRLMPDPANPTDFDLIFLDGMDDAVTRIIDAGLAVIIDPHPLSAAESDMRRLTATSDEYVQNTLMPFYHALAEHFAQYSPEWLFFETMNEPVMHEFFEGDYNAQVTQGIARWNVIQPQIIAAIREHAPEHTIIVKGDTWDNIDSLLALDMRAHNDSNLVFNVHYYEPFTFTHQGADWALPELRPLVMIPYPSSPEAVAPLLADYSGATRDALHRYGQDRWDAAKVRAPIQRVADWAARHGVRLTVNEFGAYTLNAPQADRLLLIRHMRQAFEEFNIGWAMWDFNGGFDLVEGAPMQRYITAEMADALGLNPTLR